MRAIPHRLRPWNILFGAGAVARLPGELAALGLSRALVLTTPGRARRGHELLGDRAVGLFDEAAAHVPADTVERAVRSARDLGADCTVSIGGGSTTGLGKALALELGLAQVAIPTTYSGSEMTDIWGITEAGRKRTGRDPAVLPRLVIYDPELTLTLPPRITASSGFNALAQAVANVPSDDSRIRALALEAVTLITSHLPTAVERPGDIDARSELLWGACLAGGTLGAGTTGLHHKLCHILGGALGTPHAETHAVLLPHSVAYNAAVTDDATPEIARAMRVTDAASGLHDLAKTVGAPTALAELGLDDDDVERVVKIAMEAPIENAGPVTASGLRALLEDALHGSPPRKTQHLER